MPWKVIEVDVQEEEATVNLTSIEQSAALYKVDVLAQIRSDEDVCAVPIKTSTAVSTGAFSISVSNEIFIFEGEQSNFLATLSLESCVDTMAWSPDSQFLVIGDSSGTIHFFSFARRDVVFSTKLVDIDVDSSNSSPVFCNCMFTTNEESDNVNLTILSADGCLFSFKDLPLADMSAALESKDFVFISKLKDSIQMEIVEVTNVHDKASYCTATTIFGQSSIIVAGSGNEVVSIWCDENVMDLIDCELMDGAAVRKCQMSPDGKYLVVLDEHSNLSIWDAHTLVMLSHPYHSVKDFVLTSSAATNDSHTDVVGSDGGQVVLLSDHGDGKTQLEIYELPHFKKIHSIEVSQSCSLAESNCYQERVFYTEENTSKNNNVTELMYKCLSEASPEHRVYNLVRKKKFDSALEFSKAFGLDVEFVYKAKSSTILSDISRNISESDRNLDEKAVSVDQLIEELQDSLENVKSIEFCVDCCLKASPPRLEQVYRLLCFAKEKVGKVSGKEKHKHSKEMMEVLHAIHRLETFQMVFGDDCFSARTWQHFCSGDMLTQVMQFLSQGNMSSAAIIWRRHQSEFEDNLVAESLKSVLASIRSDLPSSSIISWLKSYLVPFVICSAKNTDALYVLASWLEKRVASLELSEKEDWPGNGLGMATLLFDVLSECAEESSNYMNFPTVQITNQVYGSALVDVSKRNSKPNPVSSLSLLVEHLTELKKLHSNYQCKIPLAEFTKETPLGIMFKMLDSVLAIELIPSVIISQIMPYGIQHGFQIDDVLLKYISNQVKQVSVASLSNTLCEARLVEVAKCIKTRDKRFEAILALMSWASVPWSGVVEEMVSKAMADDPSNQSLKRSYRLMELKKILSQYGLRGIEFSNDSHVKGVVKYILGTSNVAALEDALEIVTTYHCFSKEEVYFIRLQNLCLKGLPSQIIKLLKMISNSQVIPAVQRFLFWVSMIIEDNPVDETNSQEHTAVTEAAIYILEYLQNVGESSGEMKSTLVTLKNILALQKEFSMFVPISSYEDVATRDEILLKYVREHNASITMFINKEGDSNYHQDKISRLGNLFGLSHAQLHSRFLLHKVTNDSEIFTFGTVAACNKWLSEIMCELSSEEVFNLCVTLLQKYIVQDAEVITSTETNVTVMLYCLEGCALTHSKASNLVDYVELCKLCWLSTLLYVHCESGDLCMSRSICEEDPLSSWKDADWFRDNGFVLDANVALPLHQKVLEVLMLVHQHPAEHVEKMTIACRDLILYLQGNNLHEVALHYALHSLSHLLQYSAGVNELMNAAEKKSDVTLDDSQKDPKVLLLSEMGVHGVNHISNMLLNLMSKVLCNEDIDQNLALGYLCSIPEDAALQKLRCDFAVGQGHNSSQAVTVFTIALYYAANFCDHSMVKYVKELYSAALWYSKVQKLNIARDCQFIGEKKEMKKVLELLLEKPGVDVKLIIEFCQSFGFELDATLHSYIQVNLVGGGTNYLTKAPNVDSPETTTSIKDFENNFFYAVSCISNVAKLLVLLQDVLMSLSKYDYERIAIVLNEIIKLSKDEDEARFGQQLEVLKILAEYKRTASPPKYEQVYQAKESSAVEQVVTQQKSSQERLPFHPLVYGNPWKIIGPELNDETTPKLLPLCRILKLQQDQVYVTAINNLLSSCLSDQHKEPTVSTPIESPSFNVFEKAAKLLSAVNNQEFAVKTAITLLTKWPQSEEKVKAAQATVDLAFKWKSSCEGDELHSATKIHKIAKDISQEIAVQHILHSRGVTDECFSKFIKKPAKLIFQLYEVYGCIPKANRPDVQMIAEEIAAICDLNISKIRGRLLECWLPSSCPGSIRSPEYYLSENKAKDRDNLKRVMCLLEAGSVQNNALFLLNFAYRKGPSKITYESRVRAMEVLFNVAPSEVIESVANDSLDGIRNYMKYLMYLAELEHLHLPQTVESFQHCNKEGLVKGLWKNHKDNANAILLIADICLDSKITDPLVWSNILRQLLHLGLTKYLSNLLPSLVKFPILWQTSNLVKIWEELAVLPLQKAVSPLSVDDRCLCQKSMMLLQKCPILVEVNSPKIIQKLVELDMLSHALACLSVLPRDKKPSDLSTLISPASVTHVLDMIAKERAVGECFLCPDVVEALVFEFVIASNSYEALQDSEHFLKLANYLIAQKKFAGMVLEMIKLGKLEFAVELAQHYEVYGSPLKKKSHFNDQSSIAGLNDLLTFLDSTGILEDALPYLPDVDGSVVADEKPKFESVILNQRGELDSASDVDIYDVF